jgi:predicted DNA-binding transcriptional regulator AlpA
MRLVRERERARITGVPRSTWYLKMQQGLAPKPVPLGEHAVAWVSSRSL